MDMSDGWEWGFDYMPTPNAKRRRAIQAKQAWQKYQEAETATVRDTLRQKGERATVGKETTQGGPHDIEFFRCFVTYLDEALIQI